ncbi:hypothetical protein SEA_REINDEER_59 [Mycobacterium phage Reindeer]|uniref:Uncharacterized protein n=1 Tax=Mycobacterium phage Reindeer TaxID=2762283 RepID=A0A7G8LHZ7_9CAUD|nr:hypothetical protein J4U05_gp059 [Mycobacterium phage Reindeer]QNJ56869.1 hypothetical protein SEA_REINDEER_59 [Mycobacterium phage Reindeer]
MTAIEQQLTAILVADEGDAVYCLRTEPDVEIGGFKHVDVEEGEDRRWVRGDMVIVQHVESGRYFAFDYDHGLTEYQDDEVFPDSVREVEKTTKTVEVTIWKRVK